MSSTSFPLCSSPFAVPTSQFPKLPLHRPFTDLSWLSIVTLSSLSHQAIHSWAKPHRRISLAIHPWANTIVGLCSRSTFEQNFITRFHLQSTLGQTSLQNFACNLPLTKPHCRTLPAIHPWSTRAAPDRSAISPCTPALWASSVYAEHRPPRLNLVVATKLNWLHDALLRFSQKSPDEEEILRAENTQIFHRLQFLLPNASVSGIFSTLFSSLTPFYQVLICGTHVPPQLRHFWDMLRTKLAPKSLYKASIDGMRLRLQELQEEDAEA